MTTRVLHVVAMGVSGTGKSTVAARLSDELGLELIEGDSFHPAGNVAKMSAGIPLTDEDRLPWLERLADVTREHHALGVSTVLACSALRRTFRDILRTGAPEADTYFLHLHAAYDVLEERMQARHHFMPASLLASQLQTLEPLQPDEHGEVVDVSAPLEEVVRQGVAAIRAWRGC